MGLLLLGSTVLPLARLGASPSSNLPARLFLVVAGLEASLAQLNLVPIAWRDNIDRLFFVAYLVLAYITAFRLIGGLSRWYCAEYVYKTETVSDDQFLAFFRHIAIMVLTLACIIIVLGRYNVEISALVTTLVSARSARASPTPTSSRRN